MKKVIAYVHSHWDREWYRDFEEFRLRLIEVFDEVLKALETDELPCFYFDGQTAALEDYLEIKPEKIDLIRKLIKAKKLRIGPFYCSADSFLVSGECLCRNLEMGIEKSKELGETEFIGYLSDTFGHSQDIPKILKYFNIEKACVWRGLGDLPADLKWDGTDVTYLIQGYFQDFLNTSWSIEKKAEALKKYLDKISLKSDNNVLLPIGADHLGIAKNIPEQLKNLKFEDYEFKVATPFEYFEQIKNRKNVSGEFLNNQFNFILQGVYSSRIDIKQANTNSQWLLTRIAEPLQAICHFYFNTKDKQNEINYAYKMLIKNHAHDSIYGCSIDKVHEENLIRYKKVDSVANGVIKRTIRDISDSNAPLAIINLINYEYNGKIIIETEQKLPNWMNAIKISSIKGFTDKKLYNIQDIPITEDITTINKYLIDVNGLSAFSLTQIKEENICKDIHLKACENAIENAHIKIEVKDNQVFVTDKNSGQIYKDFITIADRKDFGDSYNFGAVKGDKPVYATLKSFKLKENNKQRAILTLAYDMLKLDVTLYNQSKYLEFFAHWNNKKKNHILQIGFNLREKIKTTISEDLFSTVKRNFDPDYDIYKHLPAPKGVELKHNTAPMQRFVSSQNFVLITKGNQEYEVNKNTLYLTLLRSTGIISNPKNSTRGTPAGPPIETPMLQSLGLNKANFAVAFENSEENIYKLAEEFYLAQIPVFTNKSDVKFFETKDRVYSVKNKNSKLTIKTYVNANYTIQDIDFDIFSR